MPRLFTGLEIPQNVSPLLSSLRGGLPGARWIDPNDYHITLRFIGNVDWAMARDICATLDERHHYDNIEIHITELASFGGDKPHSIIAKVQLDQALQTLQADQERILRRIGLPADTRKFTPHVTLARMNRASALDVAQYIGTMGHFQKITFRATRFVLYSAKNSVGGGPYVVEAAYPLS